jgi:large subunit ribosomal protein L10
MAKPTKASSVAEITEHFRSSSAAVLTEYRGLTVAQLKELRRALGADVTYAVVKNTLTKIAARDAGVNGIDELLAGPSAIAFVKGDPVDAAKAIRGFAKDNPALVIKGGIMDGAALSAADINKIAELESREVLLSKLAGALKATQSQAAALFAAPLAQAARALGALQTKAQADPSVLAAGAPAAPLAPAEPEAPAAEASTEDSPAEASADITTAEESATPEASPAEETTEG